MKKAPNLKQQPADRFTEQVIFAGADAWVHAKDWQHNNRAGDIHKIRQPGSNSSASGGSSTPNMKP